MSAEDAKQFAGLQVPELDLLVRAAAGEDPAIRTESDGVDLVRVPGQSMGESKIFRPARGFGARALTVEDRLLGGAHDLALGVEGLFLAQPQLVRQSLEPLHLRPF